MRSKNSIEHPTNTVSGTRIIKTDDGIPSEQLSRLSNVCFYDCIRWLIEFQLFHKIAFFVQVAHTIQEIATLTGIYRFDQTIDRVINYLRRSIEIHIF